MLIFYGLLNQDPFINRSHVSTLGSLSKRIFETRTATGSELFSLLTCVHTTTFTLLSIVSLLQKISIKIWKTPLSWHAKCSLPVAVCVSKTCVLKLPIVWGKGGAKKGSERRTCVAHITMEACAVNSLLFAQNLTSVPKSFDTDCKL